LSLSLLLRSIGISLFSLRIGSGMIVARGSSNEEVGCDL
jgi:hypothetical protein